MNRSDAAKKGWIARKKALGTARARFWAGIDKNGPKKSWMKTNCHIWTKGKNGAGYGVFSVNGSAMYTHRYAYSEFVEPIPEGLFVLHHCDTPACCRKEHIYAGDQKDNTRDLWNRHREEALAAIAAGQKGMQLNPAIQFRHSIWRRCYLNGMTQAEIAEVFQVYPTAIQHVISAAKIPPNARRPMSPESKAKIRAANLGKKRPNPKTLARYKEWRKLRAQGMKCKDIAKRYNTTAGAVSQGTR